uniref:non-specific serine/threonine protein kinase n=1 Tax=Euplotes crassus TaxID=5936 RepID=A0A7S3P0T9_EUPCR
MTKLSQKEKENALNEVRILASIDDPNIIGYKEAFLTENPSTLCIVMEYADGGDLYDKICKCQKNGMTFPEKDIWNIFIQVVKGLKTLHNMKILHRDLKSANIFLNKDGTVKLGDLNVSKVAKMGLVHTQTGTPYYASPEVWDDKSYDFRSDIWSLGVCTYEMATLKPPFTASSMGELYKRVCSGKHPKISNNYSRDLSSIISTLLNVKPSERPSCEQILHMPAVEEHLTNEDDSDMNKELLNTIKIPRNMKLLQGKLPKSQYEDDKIEEMDDVGDLIENGNLPSTNTNDYPNYAAPATAASRDTEPTLKEVRSRHNIDERKDIVGEVRKRREKPKTTPMNLVPLKDKVKKYEMYRDLTKNKDKYGIGHRRNHNNIHQKYMERAKEIEAQEQKLKRELQHRVQDPELPDIYTKGRIGVQRVHYDPRHDSRKGHHGSSHKYLGGSENTRKPSLVIQPRIMAHKKDGLRSRGDVIDSLPPPSSKGVSPSRYKPHPYKNIYSMKANKLSQLKGIPPISKHSGTTKLNSSKQNLPKLRTNKARNKRNEMIHGIPSIRSNSNESYNPIYKDLNRPTWWG